MRDVEDSLMSPVDLALPRQLLDSERFLLLEALNHAPLHVLADKSALAGILA